MTPSRRHVLATIGGIAGPALVGPVVADEPTERVLVHPASGVLGDLLGQLESLGGSIVHEYDHFDFVAADLPSPAVTELEDDSRVALIEQDEDIGIPGEWAPSLLDLLAPGSDCSTHPDQEPTWGWERIGADAVTRTGADVDVGILDTGIHGEHCSLAVADGADFTNSAGHGDGHGHGTHVAGIVGALDDGRGVVGVAPEVSLHAVKVLDDQGNGTHGALIAGIDHCMSNDIGIISMSLGGDARSEGLDEAITEATAAGHLVLAAAGNEGNNGDGSCDEGTMTFPATHEDVLAVSAMNEDETLAGYSSVGDAVDLMGPGTDVRSTYADGGYAEASGTSMACPFVTGVAALAWDEDGPGPNEDVAARLGESAERVLGTCAEGDGLVDAAATLDADDDGDGGNGADDRIDDAVDGLPWWTVPGVAAGGVAGYGATRWLIR